MIKARDLIELGKAKLKDEKIPNYKLDARILLSHILNLENNFLFSDVYVSDINQETYFKMIKDRVNGKPVSKIISKRSFWNYEFFVNASTLDPRPDSEVLVEAALETFKLLNKNKLNILELGVGSGCILLSILEEVNGAKGWGVDIDFDAIKVAKINAINMKISDKVNFIVSDWAKSIQGKFDIIISNPPYIKSSQIKSLQKEVKDYDPLLALDGGQDGLDCYKIILKNIKTLMKKQSFLIFEIDFWQGNEIIELSKQNKLKFLSRKKDLSGQERCLIFKS